MKDSRFDAALISTYGRGHWLAAELARQNLKVVLLDVSDAVGRLTPEDAEGPFGLFQLDNFRPLQVARLNEEEYSEVAEAGFTVWPPQGPLELKSPLTSFWLEMSGLSPETQKYLMSYEQLPVPDRVALSANLAQQDFSKIWLAALAHQLASTVYHPNAAALSWGRPLPIFSPWSVRRVTRRSWQKSEQWLRDQGVGVSPGARLMDIEVKEGKVASLEIKGERSGIVAADQVFWLLTSEETARFGPAFGEALFGRREPLLSTWAWLRYRLQLTRGPYLRVLPHQMALVSDLALPWTHANLCIVQRTAQEQTLDVWVRLPSLYRFQKDYLEGIGEELSAIFRRRIPGSEPVQVELPQEFRYGFEELGPPRFPVYSVSDWRRRRTKDLTNVYFDSPEEWDSLDWTGQLRHQEVVLAAAIADRLNDRMANDRRLNDRGNQYENELPR